MERERERERETERARERGPKRCAGNRLYWPTRKTRRGRPALLCRHPFLFLYSRNLRRHCPQRNSRTPNLFFLKKILYPQRNSRAPHPQWRKYSKYSTQNGHFSVFQNFIVRRHCPKRKFTNSTPKRKFTNSTPTVSNERPASKASKAQRMDSLAEFTLHTEWNRTTK